MGAYYWTRERRTVKFQVKFTAGEREHYEKVARERGLTMSGLVRQALRDYERERREQETGAERAENDS